MNEKMARNSWIVAIAAVALSVLALSALPGPRTMTPDKPQPQKICPITFHLDPVTTLQNRIARDTERTNAKLAQDLVEWRTAKALLPDYAREKAALVASLEDAYANTYLAHPVLWDETGTAHAGWGEILAYMATVYPKANYIHPQSVNAYLEYLPLANQTAEYLKTKLKVASLSFEPGEVDFLINIRTVIAYSPYDAPMEIGNESLIPHRKVCDPIY
jgi:hypothetical protein